MRRKAAPPVPIRARTVGKVKLHEHERIVLDHARLHGENYSGRKLLQFCTIGCQLQNCRFDKTQIEDAQFGAGREMSEFIECSFDSSRMYRISGGPSRFVRCSFRNADLRHWISREVELIDCVFSGRLQTAVFNGKVRQEKQSSLGRTRNEFRGNDFSEMEFVDVGFRTGVDLSLQRLPSGPDYLYLPDAASAVQRAKSALLGWRNLELRRPAMHAIKCLEREIEEGQQQLLLKISDEYLYASPPRQAVDTLFALLRGDILTLD